MLVPRYLYRGDFSPFRSLLLAQPHTDRTFQVGEQLWRPGEYIERVYYIEQGIAKTSLLNEDGREKTVYFHGSGMVFPGCHESQFAIELSLVTQAVTPIVAMEFQRSAFHDLLRTYPELASAMLENYARYINVLIFESAHQERNEALVKLCNLIYLLALDAGSPGGPASNIEMSQEELAELLAMNRVSVAKLLSRLRDEGIVVPHRGGIDIADVAGLLSHCSYEVSCQAR